MRYLKVALITCAFLPAIANAKSGNGEESDSQWNGGYIGVTLGYGAAGGRQDVTNLDPKGSLVDPSGLTQAVLFPAQLQAKRNGILGGVEAGYNVQKGTYVFGVEGDLSLLRSRGPWRG
jgi:outer membrane immunogenic protein